MRDDWYDEPHAERDDRFDYRRPKRRQPTTTRRAALISAAALGLMLAAIAIVVLDISARPPTRPAGAASAAPSTDAASAPTISPVVSIGPSAALPTPSASVEPSSPPGAGPSPSEQPPPSPAPSPPTGTGLILEWRREQRGFGDAEIRDSAVVGDRIVVIGTRYADDDKGYVGAIWWEDEDLVWRESSLPASSAGGAGAQLYDIAAVGPRLVVVGRYDSWPVAPLVWTSTDGTSWSAAQVDVGDRAISLRHVAAAVDGLVAFGSEDFGEWAAPNPVALVSADGTAWVPAVNQATHDLLPVGVSRVLAGTGNDLTAFVAGEGRRRPVSVWRATGADDWRKVADLPRSNRLSVSAAVVGPLGWIAIGASARDQVAWTSADGIDWQLAENAPQLAQAPEAAFGDRAGFIVVGWYDPVGGCSIDPTNWRNQTWTSSDGRIWRLAHEMGEGANIQSLRRRGRTLIGIGMIGDGEGAVWTARLPRASSDEGPPPSHPLPEDTDGCR